jgi:RNA polymerase sigma-70 factor (ECF subfamily)
MNTQLPSSQLSENAVSDLYDLHMEKIYRFFYYKVLSKEVAEDLTSETFLTFVNSIKKGKNISNPKNFLFGIAKFIFLKYLKKKYQANEIPLSFESIDFVQYIEDFIQEIDRTPTIEERAIKYIHLLPEKQRDVIYMRLIQKMNLSEIAQKLGKDMNYVKKTQQRGLRNLRNLIEVAV